MNRAVGGHGVQKRDVVDFLGQIRKEVAHPFPALAVLIELPARLNDPPLVFAPPTPKGLHGDSLVIASDHVGLVIKRVDVAGASVHIQEDAGRRIWIVVRWFGGERVLIPFGSGLCPTCVLPQQRRSCDRRESTARLPEHLAPGTTTEISG